MKSLKIRIYQITFILMVIVFGSTCKEKDEEPVITVTPLFTEIDFTADGSGATAGGSLVDLTFAVVTNDGVWKATSDQTWLSVKRTDKDFTLSATVNSSSAMREAVVIIETFHILTPVTLQVKQVGMSLTLSSTEAVTINKEGTVATTGTLTYTVTSNIDWEVESSQPSWLRVNKSGTGFTLSATANERTPRRAQVAVKAFNAPVALLEVMQEGAIMPPPYAVTSKVWAIESADGKIKQEWSDYIEYDGNGKVASGTIGNLSNYSTTGTTGDYIKNPSYAGYLYNWYYVVAHQQELCPSPWRVPTQQDFVDLDKGLGGTGENGQKDAAHLAKYDAIGFTKGGRVTVAPAFDRVGTYMYLYSFEESPSSTTKGVSFGLSAVDGVMTHHDIMSSSTKNVAFPVRCVRDGE